MKNPVKPISGRLQDLFSIVPEAFRVDAIEEFVELNSGVEIEFICNDPRVVEVVVHLDDAIATFVYSTRTKGLRRSSWKVGECTATAKQLEVMHSALCKKYQRFAR